MHFLSVLLMVCSCRPTCQCKQNTQRLNDFRKALFHNTTTTSSHQMHPWESNVIFFSLNKFQIIFCFSFTRLYKYIYSIKSQQPIHQLDCLLSPFSLSVSLMLSPASCVLCWRIVKTCRGVRHYTDSSLRFQTKPCWLTLHSDRR